MSAGVPLRKRWVTDEMMVTSETGARLSPKMAPERTAPASMVGSAPSATPAGKKIGMAARSVPMDEPVAAAIREEARSTKTVKAWPVRCSIPPRKTSPSATPEAFIMAEKMPEAIRMSTTVPVSSDEAPRTAAFQYSDGDFARSEPEKSVRTPAAARPVRSKAASEMKSMAVTATKSASGRRRTAAEPWNRSVVMSGACRVMVVGGRIEVGRLPCAIACCRTLRAR